MPMHAVLFDSAIGSGSTLVKCSALSDTYSNIQNNNLVVDSVVNQIVGAYAYGANMTRAQLQAPSLQVPGYPDLRRIANAVPTDAIEPQIANYLDNPLALKPTEQLSLFVINGSTSQQEYGIVLLADKPPTPVKGRIFTLKLTGTTTVTADAISACPLTFEDNLPVGTYDVVGCRWESTSVIFGRIGAAGIGYRPGGIGTQTAKAAGFPGQRFGGWGVWFSFSNTVQLVADYLCTAGDTAQTVYLDVIGPR